MSAPTLGDLIATDIVEALQRNPRPIQTLPAWQRICNALEPYLNSFGHTDADPSQAPGLARDLYTVVWQDSLDATPVPVALWAKTSATNTGWERIWPVSGVSLSTATPLADSGSGDPGNVTGGKAAAEGHRHPRISATAASRRLYPRKIPGSPATFALLTEDKATELGASFEYETVALAPVPTDGVAHQLVDEEVSEWWTPELGSTTIGSGNLIHRVRVAINDSTGNDPGDGFGGGDPLWESVTALLHLNTSLYDEYATGNWTGSGVQQTVKKLGAGSIYTVAGGSQATGPEGTGRFTFGTGPFTVEFWAKPASAGSGLGVIVGTWHPVTQEGWYVGYYNGYIHIGLKDSWYSSTARPLVYPDTTEFVHIRVCRDEDHTLYLFINGHLDASWINATASLAPAGPPGIGYDPDYGGSHFNGYIDEVRITKACRSTTDFDVQTHEYNLFAAWDSGPRLRIDTILGHSDKTVVATCSATSSPINRPGNSSYVDLEITVESTLPTSCLTTDRLGYRYYVINADHGVSAIRVSYQDSDLPCSVDVPEGLSGMTDVAPHAPSHVTGADQIPDATASVHGLMTAAAVTKLAGISGTNTGDETKSRVDSLLGVTADATKYYSKAGTWETAGGGTHAATHVTGGGDTIADAIAGGNSGLMSGTDKTKLNGIASGANVGVVPNAAISPGTATKVTYDAKGLVTGGASATTADIADSADKRYCTDAQKTVIGNTSGTNTGDQTLPTDATIVTTDVTTNDVSTSKHGWAPKLPNDSTKFLNGVGGWAVPAGGSSSRTRPSTSNCAIYWDFSSGPAYSNIGSGGALSLNTASSSVVSSREGLFGKAACTHVISSDNKKMLVTDPTSVGESSSITVAFWVNPARHSDWAVLLAKNYSNTDLSSSPYYAWDFRYNSSYQNWYIGLCTSGTLRELGASWHDSLAAIGVWTHCGFTYNHTTGVLTVYRNGEAVVSTTLTPAAIDYGTHGRYVVGADWLYTPREVHALFEDIRIIGSVLSAADMMAIYDAALLPRG